jgi:hypothetical protein
MSSETLIWSIWKCIKVAIYIAPNDFGQWADVCGQKFLFGNKIVRITVNRREKLKKSKWTHIIGQLAAKQGEMLQSWTESNYFHFDGKAKMSKQLHKE